MAIILQDTFARADVSGTWGTATDGNAWTTQTLTAGTVQVSVNEGQASNINTGSADLTLGSVTSADGEVLFRWQPSDVGDDAFAIIRFQSVGNFYYLGQDLSGIQAIKKRVAGSGTTLISTPRTLTANSWYWIRARVQGSTLSVREWLDGTTEPTTWDLQVTDTTYTVAGKFGVHLSTRTLSNTLQVDHFSVDNLANVSYTLGTRLRVEAFANAFSPRSFGSAYTSDNIEFPLHYSPRAFGSAYISDNLYYLPRSFGSAVLYAWHILTDTALRLRLLSVQKRDLAGRLRLLAVVLDGVATRLVLFLGTVTSKNVASRLLLLAVRLRDAANRLRLKAASARDSSSRLHLGGGVGYRNTVINDNPRAYYRLNTVSGTTVPDESGNGYTATLSGVTTPSQPGAVASDTATLFTTGEASLVLPPALNPSAWSALSLEYWIKLSGSWQHVAVTTDDAVATLYLNGAVYTPTDGDPVVMDILAYAGSYLPGSLDEVALYAYTLTPEQVRTHFTLGIQDSQEYAPRAFGSAYLTSTLFSLPRSFGSALAFGWGNLVHVATRLVLVGGTTTLKNLAARLRLLAGSTANLATRLRLLAVGLRDVPTRLRVSVTRLLDQALRLPLLAQRLRDQTLRLLLSALTLTGLSTRLRLLSIRFQDEATRTRLLSASSKDQDSRLRLLTQRVRDSVLRFLLSAVQQEDQAARVRVQENLHYFPRAFGSNYSVDVPYPQPRSFGSTLLSLWASFLDTPTRLRLFATRLSDQATRVRLLIGVNKDLSIRLLLLSSRLENVASRTRLLVALSKDNATRTRLFVTRILDVAARLLLRAVQQSNLATRTRLLAVQVRDLSLRLRLAIPPKLDQALRLRLLVIKTTNNLGTRLPLLAVRVRDQSLRLRLLAVGSRDLSTRFLLQVVGLIAKDQAARLRLLVLRLRDAVSRVRLQAVRSLDQATRTRLLAVTLSNVALRLRLLVVQFQSAAVRLRLLAQRLSDTVTRTRLSATVNKGGATRVRLLAQHLLDSALRLRLLVLAKRDLAARFVLIPSSATLLRDVGYRLSLYDGASTLLLSSRDGALSSTTRSNLSSVFSRDGASRIPSR